MWLWTTICSSASCAKIILQFRSCTKTWHQITKFMYKLLLNKGIDISFHAHFLQAIFVIYSPITILIFLIQVVTVRAHCLHASPTPVWMVPSASQTRITPTDVYVCRDLLASAVKADWVSCGYNYNISVMCGFSFLNIYTTCATRTRCCTPTVACKLLNVFLFFIFLLLCLAIENEFTESIFD